LILLTLRTLREMLSPLELLTSSLLEKERNQSLLSYQEKVSKEDLRKKETSDKRDNTIDLDALFEVVSSLLIRGTE